jgi:hypothetical protein
MGMVMAFVDTTKVHLDVELVFLVVVCTGGQAAHGLLGMGITGRGFRALNYVAFLQIKGISNGVTHFRR